jgi:hypothetical protein
MAGKVVNSSFMLLSKFGASRQESASKTATSHIREPSDCLKTPYLLPNKKNKFSIKKGYNNPIISCTFNA